MDLPAAYKDAVQFAFGDSKELADRLLALVLAGKKTATCGALRDHGDGPDQEPMPVVGRHDVVLDGRGTPRCAIRTTEVTQCRFDAVSHAFALAEGEGDFAQWRAAHIAFFTRNGGWSEDLMLVCERFEVVEVFA